MTRSYEEACRLFRWQVPEHYNFAVEAVDRQASGSADAHRTALVTELEGGIVARYTFLELLRFSNRLADVLRREGISKGDRVALVMAPSGEAAVGFLGILKTGAVAVPLAFDMEPVPFLERLSTLGVVAILGDEHSAHLLRRARRDLSGLKLTMSAHATENDLVELWTSLIDGAEDFPAEQTLAEDPAVILQSPATGGAALYPHRALKARVHGAEFAFQGFPHVGDVVWSVTNWADNGGWLDAVLPAWYHGVPVVATPAPPEALPGLLSRRGVRNVHLPVSSLPLFRKALGRSRTPLRSLVIVGTPSPIDAGWLIKRFGEALIPAFCAEPFGLVIAPSPALGYKTPVGALGRPVPGYAVDVIDFRGRVLPAGETGALAVLADTPAMPLALLDASLPPVIGRWQPLGAEGHKDLDGIFWPDPPQEPPVFPPEPGNPLHLGAPDPRDRWK